MRSAFERRDVEPGLDRSAVEAVLTTVAGGRVTVAVERTATGVRGPDGFVAPNGTAHSLILWDSTRIPGRISL